MRISKRLLGGAGSIGVTRVGATATQAILDDCKAYLARHRMTPACGFAVNQASKPQGAALTSLAFLDVRAVIYFACWRAAVRSCAEVHAGENWPAWRGPTGDGHSDEKNLPLTWGGKSQENILWKTPLFPSDKVRRDQNQSSPIVWGDRVFVTVSYWPEGTSDKDYPQHHVLCFGAKDGTKRWDTLIPPGPWKLTDLRGGYTCGTPATDGKHVYVNFGSAVVAAVDFQGQIAWRKEITPYKFDVAWAASPVLYQDTVIIVCDQIGKASTIYAFDGKSGELRWEKKRPNIDWAHSTPLLAKVGPKLQLLTATHRGPQGIDPATGEILWFYQDSKQVGDTVTPTVRDGLIYVDSGRGGDGGGIAVDATGSGDVSKTHLKWKVPNFRPGFSSPILVGDYLYRLQGGDLLSSWKWTTGEEVFKGRLEGADTAVSPFATADGLIYCASGNKSYVLKAGPKLEILARSDLGDSSRASPAVAAGRIYVKGGRFLWCVGRSDFHQPGLRHLHQLQTHRVQRLLGRAALNLGACAGPVERRGRNAAVPRHTHIDQPNRLVGHRAAGTCQSGGADGEIGLQPLPAAQRHRLGHRSADRAVDVKEIVRYAELLDLDAVVVGDDAAAKPGARAGNLPQTMRDQAGRDALRGRQALAAFVEQADDGVLQFFLVHAIDVFT